MAQGRKGGNPLLAEHKFKKGDSKARECQAKGATAHRKNRKAKATLQEITKAVLDSQLSGDAFKKAKKLYPDLSDGDITNMLGMVSHLYHEFFVAERPTDKIALFNTLIQNAGYSQEAEMLKQAEQLKQKQHEDDPFSKSIKELIEKQKEGQI